MHVNVSEINNNNNMMLCKDDTKIASRINR